MNIQLNEVSKWITNNVFFNFIKETFSVIKIGIMLSWIVFAIGYYNYGWNFVPVDIIKKNSLIVKDISESLSEGGKKYEHMYGNLNFVRLTFDQNSGWPKLEANSNDKFLKKEVVFSGDTNVVKFTLESN